MNNKIEELNMEIAILNEVIDMLQEIKIIVNNKIKPKGIEITESYKRSISSEIMESWKGTSGKGFNERVEETSAKIVTLESDWDTVVETINSDINNLYEEVQELEYRKSLEESNG